MVKNRWKRTDMDCVGIKKKRNQVKDEFGAAKRKSVFENEPCIACHSNRVETNQVVIKDL